MRLKFMECIMEIVCVTFTSLRLNQLTLCPMSLIVHIRNTANTYNATPIHLERIIVKLLNLLKHFD